MITARVDISGMKTVLRELSFVTMLPMKEVTTAESLAVLQTCLDRTKLTPAGTIRDRLDKSFHQFGDHKYGGKSTEGVFPRISIAPNKGNVWFVEPVGRTGRYSRSRKGGLVFHLINKHYEADSTWSDYQQQERDRQSDQKSVTAERIGRRGLPKQVWFYLAEGLGYSLKASQAVIAATVKGAPLRSVAQTMAEERPGSFVVTFVNSSTASLRKDAEGILRRTLEGRVKYFRRSLELGVFDSMAKVVKSYPNLAKVHRS